MRQHQKLAKAGSDFLISRAIKKYGWENFEVDVLFSGLSEAEAVEKEIRLIRENKACYDAGYNMQPGGQLGVSLRPETREKRSKAAKHSWATNPAVRAVVANPARNRKISESSKRMNACAEYKAAFRARHARMIEASMTEESLRKRTDTRRENGNLSPILCSNGKMFESISDAGRWLANLAGKPEAARSFNSNICACANGRKKSAYGFSWSYTA